MASMAWADTNVTFQWDKNTESDLAGYKIYSSATSGSGYTEIKDVLVADCPASPCQATVTGIVDGTWYFVVTAYDNYGNESGYSNEITDTFDTTPPEPPQNLSIWQKILAWLCRVFGLLI